jgi:hypothetical protein
MLCTWQALGMSALYQGQRNAQAAEATTVGMDVYACAKRGMGDESPRVVPLGSALVLTSTRHMQAACSTALVMLPLTFVRRSD